MSWPVLRPALAHHAHVFSATLESLVQRPTRALGELAQTAIRAVSSGVHEIKPNDESLVIASAVVATRQHHTTARRSQANCSSLSLALRLKQPLQLIRHASVLSNIPAPPPPSSSAGAQYSTTVLPKTIPYSKLTVGAPRETFPNERRVALTPQNVALLLKKGFAKVLVERGAGAEAQFLDEAYEKAGATLVDGASPVWRQADIVLKVRGPSEAEVDQLHEGQTIISFLQPAQNKNLVTKIAAKKATSFAMDMIPRISRAQVFDALSSMANIAGYKAVLEASNNFGRFLTGQVTAAGKIPPCKVLIIGAGVAGLSAIATARRMGAVVRGFDTRPAAREQVQSLGAEFIEVDFQEDGSGAGGYAKEMSKGFIEAEMKLFTEQARDVDIIITTALIPGRPAPKLITKAMVEIMRPGSVIVDLAAEAGGNCEKTEPGKLVTYHDVKIIGEFRI